MNTFLNVSYGSCACNWRPPYLFLLWALYTIANSHRLLGLIFKEAVPFLFPRIFKGSCGQNPASHYGHGFL